MSDDGNGNQVANRGSNAAAAAIVGSGVGPTNQAAAVIVYTDAEFKGRSAKLAVGRHVLDPELNDTISSVRVPAGYSVTLYDAPDFSGDGLTLRSDTARLPSAFEDKVSSIRVLSEANTSGVANTSSVADTAIRQGNVTIIFS